MDSQFDDDEICPLRNYYVGETATSILDFNSKIEVFHVPRETCGTKIIGTIGPACAKPEVLRHMIQNGMSIARLNFSHGDHAYHMSLVNMIRELSKEIYPRDVAIALDTKGPEIRTGTTVNNEPITLVTDSTVTLTSKPEFKDKCTSKLVYIDYDGLSDACTPGRRILLADGSATLKVIRLLYDGNVECKVMCGAKFGSKKNCCIPRSVVDLPTMSDMDIKDIEFAVINKFDMIFASFVRCAKNVRDVRETIKKFDPESKILIISKIENNEGITNINEIIAVSDGIMVARGDLGMDLSLSKVLVAQKMIIARCNLACKPVICATQMMESMIYNNRPTRAEVTDIGNAVLDGADCVMLSGETANGKYPVTAVKKMNKVCRESEDIIMYKRVYENIKNSKLTMTYYESVSMAAVSISFKINADAIIVLTTSGRTAYTVSNFRPRCPIIVVSRDEGVVRRLSVWRNIIPSLYPIEFEGTWDKDVDNRLDYALRFGKLNGLVQPESRVVFVCGWQKGPGFSNTIRIITVGNDDTVKGMSKVHSMNKLGNLS